MDGKKLLVCGGRHFALYPETSILLNKLSSDISISTIIEGGANGADALAARWVYHRNQLGNGYMIAHIQYPADWDKFGKAAGHIRNAQMLSEGKPDIVLALPGGTGTQNMIDRSLKAQKTVLQAVFDDSALEIIITNLKTLDIIKISY